MSIFIRDVGENDFIHIYELMKNEMGYAHLDELKTFSRLNKMIRSDDYKMFAAVENDKVIGFLGMFFGLAFNVDGLYAQILALTVKSTRQGMGIGAELLAKAESYVKDQGLSDIALNSSFPRERAHKFYEKNGYSKKSFVFKKEL